jgi:plastocyanin
MKKGIVRGAILLIAGLLLSFAPQVRGDATVYWDFENGFSPGTIVIGPGDTMTWWNVDPYGFDVRVTFDNSLSFFLLNLHGSAVTFPSQPGIYGYQSDNNDYGAVIVNVAPTVLITTPTNNAVLPAPATFTIQATASDTPDDFVSDVEFYLGTSDATNSIADVFDVPYSASVTNLDAGIYTLIAVARDSHGWTSTNSIMITVSSGTSVTLIAPRISAGQFLFDVMGLTVGKTNIVQASTNLISWTAIKTNVADNTAMTFTNATTLPRRFFRLVELP